MCLVNCTKTTSSQSDCSDKSVRRNDIVINHTPLALNTRLLVRHSSPAHLGFLIIWNTYAVRLQDVSQPIGIFNSTPSNMLQMEKRGS